MTEIQPPSTDPRFQRLYFLIGGVGFTVVVIGPELLTTIIRLIGGTTANVAVFISVTSLMSQFGVILAPLVLSLLVSRKRMLIAASLLAWLGMIVLSFSISLFSGALAIAAVIASISIYNLGAANVNLPFSDLLRRKLDDQTRISTIGKVNSLALITTAAAGLVVKRLLDQGLIFPAGFSLLILVGALLYLLTVAAYSRIQEDTPTQAEKLEKQDLGKNYRSALNSVLHNRSLRVLFITVIFFTIASSSAQIFISHGYDLDFETMKKIVAIGIPLGLLIKAAAYYLAGNLAARKGSRLVLILIGLAGLGTPLAAMFLPVEYFLVIMICNQLIPMWYPFFLNETFRLSDNATFPGNFLVFSLLPLPVTLLMPFLGVLANSNSLLFSTLVFLSLIAGILLLILQGRAEAKKTGK